MKRMITIAIALSLMATTAFAGSLRSGLKIEPTKDSAFSANAGFLNCAGAVEMTIDNIYAGDNLDTLLVPNNVTTYGCSTWNESGGEVVYHIFFATPTMWVATLTPTGGDLDLAVLDGCDENLNCLGVFDASVQSSTPFSGDVYFVVDGYNGARASFTLELATQIPPPPPPAVDFCASVLDVFGNVFTGDTCTGQNNIFDLACKVYTENGLENYYEIFMPAGSSFTADVLNTADGALWVVDACADPMMCLAYTDATFSNQSEVITYTNTGATDTYVYLVIDSWGTASCGTYTMNFTSTGGAVPAEGATFGMVKALYR